MTIVGEAWINIRAHTEAFKKDVIAGTEPALAELETESKLVGERSGKSLSGGFGNGLKGLAGSLTGLGLPLGAAGEGVGKLGEHMAETETKGKSLGQTFQSVSSGAMLGLAAGAAVIGVESIKMAGQFDTAMAGVQASAGISAKAAKSIGDAFQSTAGTSEFSSTEMATAYAKVAGSLGLTEGHALTAKQALSVMNAAGELATATGGDLTSVTATLGNVMQAYGLKAQSAADTTDVLYNVARVTGSGVDTVASTFTKLHSTLGAVTPSIGDVGALMVDMAAHGETGRKALSAVNTSLTGLLQPAKSASLAQFELGTSFADSNGKFIGMRAAISELQPKLAGMTQAQQLATLKAVGFGEANKALLDTIMAGPAGYDKASESVNKLGSAHAAAALKANTLPVEMKTMKATMDDLFTTIGQKLIPILQKMGAELLKVVNFLTHHKDVAIALGIVLAGIFVAMLAGWVINTIAAMSFWAAATGGIIILVAAIGIGIAWIVSHWSAIWKECHRIIEEVWTWIKEHWKLLLDILLGPIGFAVGFIISHFKQIKAIVMDVVDWIKSHWKLLLEIITGPIGFAIMFVVEHFHQIVQTVSEVIDAVVEFFSGLPGKIAAFFAGIWDKIWADFKQVAVWLYTNVEAPVIKWVTELPGKMYHGFLNILDTIWADFKQVAVWLYLNVELPVIQWVTSLPGKVYHAMLNFFDTAWADLKNVMVWLGVNVEWPVINWVTALPGKVAAKVTSFFDTAFADLKNIGQWLDTNIWQPMSSFFSGLPDKVAHAVGNLLGKVTGSIGGAVGGALSAIGLAVGGYIDKPTLAVVGEAGPEVVLPLSNPQRMNEILGSVPGLGSSIGRSGASGSVGGSTYIAPGAFVVHVHGAADPGVASAAVGAVNSGLAALTGALGRGRSPVRSGQ